MNIYLITRKDIPFYDEFISWVVQEETEEDAKLWHPIGVRKLSTDHITKYLDEDNLICKKIGIADNNEAGIIHTQFLNG